MMDIYTRLLMMDIMISAVAIMVNILENCPINGKIHNISRILIISSLEKGASYGGVFLAMDLERKYECRVRRLMAPYHATLPPRHAE